MKIIETKCKITLWRPTAEIEFEYPCKTGETIGFELLSLKDYEMLFHINAYIHFTCPNTNFLLDVEANLASHINFKDNTITAKKLYAAYKIIRLDWINMIIQEGQKRNYNNIIPATQVIPYPFEKMKVQLEKKIHEFLVH